MNKQRESLKASITRIVREHTNINQYLTQKEIIYQYHREKGITDEKKLDELYRAKQGNFANEMGGLERSGVLGRNGRRHYYYRDTNDPQRIFRTVIIENIHFAKETTFVVSTTEYDDQNFVDVTIAVCVDPRDIHNAISQFGKFYGEQVFFGAIEQNGMLLLLLRFNITDWQDKIIDLSQLVEDAYAFHLKKHARKTLTKEKEV